MAITNYKTKPNDNIFNNAAINTKYANVANALNNTRSTISNNIFKAGTVSQPETSTESLYDTLRGDYPTLNVSSYSGGGGGMTNLSNIFASLEQGAETQRQVAKDTYNTKREDLLRDLERFQEENKRNIQNQQKAYLSNQASLESAIAQADRQNRISAAARGLGGSGLQQLAQLQNLLSQGQTISDMATENQNAMDTLRRALAEKEEDTKTAEDRALADYNNALMEIASNLAMNKSNYEYQAQEAANNRAASAANIAAQIASQNAQYEAQARADERSLKSQLSTLQKNYSKDIDSIEDMSSSALKKAYGSSKKADAYATIYNNYYANLGDILNAYGVGGTSVADKQYDTLASLYRQALGTNSKSSNWLSDWWNSGYTEDSIIKDKKGKYNWSVLID